MATIQKFEDIEAWKKARELNRTLYRRTNIGPIVRDFSMKDQVRRASLLVMSNIAEGFERNGNPEFLHVLSIAKASAGEVRSLLYAMLDVEYIAPDEFDGLSRLAEEVGKMIGGLMNYLAHSDLKGAKRK